MARILIAFGTTHGQTHKIAEYLADELRSLGHHVEVSNAELLPLHYHLDLYDGFIGGASVHNSRFQKPFRNWIRRHAKDLNEMPSLFFSVCLGILQEDPSVQEKEQRIVHDFLEEVGWRPGMVSILAGALAYSHYNWLLKRIMRSIARKGGASTDMTHDYEYTDWPAVKEVALAFSSTFRHTLTQIGTPSQGKERPL